MPATARHVAGRMGISVNSKTITNPEKNLSIGSWYLNYLHDYFDGNSFLAVPAYNAGEGNVGKWAKEWGHRPTDEYVEAIPIRETRHYVKRVLGTYQPTVWSGGMARCARTGPTRCTWPGRSRPSAAVGQPELSAQVHCCPPFTSWNIAGGPPLNEMLQASSGTPVNSAVPALKRARAR